jgi:putative GTP pyrophosphokinase
MYEEYAKTVLLVTERELRKFFSDWREPSAWADQVSSSRMPAPSPIKRSITRIKRPESVADKILRKPSSFQNGFSTESIKEMRDTLGARIIVYFLSNLPMVDRALRRSEVLEISSEDPPVAYLSRELWERFGLKHVHWERKESGYASIHYVVRLRSSEIPLADRPWFEIQVRTLVEDVWGEIEHILGYKPNKRTSFAVKKQFQIISSQLTAIDEHFNLLYEELARFQEEATYRDLDPLNAENLPAVLSEIGISCAQREIDGLLKLLTSRGVKNVGELRESANQKRLNLIKSIFQEIEGRPPTHFEIVAAIGATHSLEDDGSVKASVVNQIEFLKAWEKLKPSVREKANPAVHPDAAR